MARLTQREYDEAELRDLRWKLADVTSPARQTEPTEEGQAYREQLAADIRELEERLASEKG
jgi:hypothetical protein